MPAPSCRMYPERTRNLWLATSASAGASRRVGMKSLDQRLHGYLQGTGESREPWSRELGAKQESGVRRQESGDSTDDCVLTFKFRRGRSSSRLASKGNSRRLPCRA